MRAWTHQLLYQWIGDWPNHAPKAWLVAILPRHWYLDPDVRVIKETSTCKLPSDLDALRSLPIVVQWLSSGAETLPSLPYSHSLAAVAHLELVTSILSPYTMVWSIWKAGNELVFKEKKPDFSCYIDLIESRCVFWVKACYNFKVYFIIDYRRCISGVR